MTTTGEQPAAKEPALSLTFDRLVVLVGFVGSLCAAYGGYRVTQNDVEKHESRLAACESNHEKQRDAHASLKERVSLTETRGADMLEKLNKMDAKLDRLLESRGNRSANYQPRGPGGQ